MLTKYGLIGYPLSHSFSEKYFTEKFAREGIKNHVYSLYPLATIDDLPDLLRREPGLHGLNVTIPYKEKVLPFLDKIDPAAAAVGAVNTVKIRDGKLTGYNTDVYGFEQSLLALIEQKTEDLQALVLGTGGAAKAVAYILQKLKIDCRYVSRSGKNGALTYSEIDGDKMKKRRLIVNTTPLGMSPNNDTLPDLPYRFLRPEHFLYDLVYNPELTAFLKKGKDAGARTKNGLEMLYLQAEKAWEIWQNSEEIFEE